MKRLIKNLKNRKRSIKRKLPLTHRKRTIKISDESLLAKFEE